MNQRPASTPASALSDSDVPFHFSVSLVRADEFQVTSLIGFKPLPDSFRERPSLSPCVLRCVYTCSAQVWPPFLFPQ